MATSPANAASFGGRTNVRIAVVGDPGTGKSSLIAAALAGDSFPERVAHVLAPTRLPADYFPDRVPITIIDTSTRSLSLFFSLFLLTFDPYCCRPENRAKLIAEVQMADAIVLTYACDRPSTLDRLSTYWLPELRRQEVTVPVIVVGCKMDLRDEQEHLHMVMNPMMQQFREIETCIECSALRQIQVPVVFYYAQKAVVHPTSPLFDQETHSLKPRCVSALKRIFILCDHDKDDALSDVELNDFQVKCFNAPLQFTEISGLKNVVQERVEGGVNDYGLTLPGFLFLHALFIERGRLETTWTVLRKFGYNNDLKIRDDLLPTSIFGRAPDQSVELTDEAVEFLKSIFFMFDTDNDGALIPAKLAELFSTAPESPCSELCYKDAVEKHVSGGLSLEGFLSEWALLTLLDPAGSMANIIYIGYNSDPATAFHITRRRRFDHNLQQSQRNVYQCFVFGPKKAGKSALLNALIGRTFSEKYTPTTNERFAANVVELPGGNKKTLVMREVPEDQVKALLSNKESLAACDIAVFVHDSSDENSWKKATELLLLVSSHGENNGFEVPCLIISAKDDLDPYPLAIQDSTRVSQAMGIETPIPVSMRLRDFNNVFSRIVSAAQHPHLSIPETVAGKNRKQYRQLVNRSLVFVSVGAAVAIVAGLAAYRVYASRKSSST